jgi:hypothetical protein
MAPFGSVSQLKFADRQLRRPIRFIGSTSATLNNPARNIWLVTEKATTSPAKVSVSLFEFIGLTAA